MIIKNIQVVTSDEVLYNSSIEIEGKLIKAIGSSNDEDVFDGEGLMAMPGFIDIHTHGILGIDYMDATVEDYKTVANELYKEGVTTFLATTLTASEKDLLRVAETVGKAKELVPSLGGIHLEGPYIAASKKGAQNEEFIRRPNVNELRNLIIASNNNIKNITLAPELEGSDEFIKQATRLGVTCSAGHSDASFNDVMKAIVCGLTNTTHLHNAMSGHHHRNPGIVSAAFYSDRLFTEVISDGIHVSPEAVKTTFKVVGSDRFIIITDSLAPKHSSEQEFKLYGLDCVKKNGAAYLTSGPLCGSLLDFDQGVRNIHEFTGCSYVDLAKVSSRNAAKSIHLDDRGELKAGLLADIVLLDRELHVKHVFKEGKLIF